MWNKDTANHDWKLFLCANSNYFLVALCEILFWPFTWESKQATECSHDMNVVSQAKYHMVMYVLPRLLSDGDNMFRFIHLSKRYKPSSRKVFDIILLIPSWFGKLYCVVDLSEFWRSIFTQWNDANLGFAPLSSESMEGMASQRTQDVLIMSL